MTDPSPDEVEKRKPASPGGTPVLHADTTGSTNADAMVHVEVGETGPLWIHADQQTDGRGRSGRQWMGAQGNLHASFFATFKCSLQSAAQLSLVAGVAMIEAVGTLSAGVGEQDKLADKNLRLKWPNDLFCDGAKLGGVLIETTAVAPDDTERAVVIGFGLNLAIAPELPDRPTTSLSALLGRSVSAVDMLSHLDIALLSALRDWDSGAGFGVIRKRWLTHSGPEGEKLTVHLGAEKHLNGCSAGLDPSGALLLRDDFGTLHMITFGDVELGSTSTQTSGDQT